jgi:hypothetical protein
MRTLQPIIQQTTQARRAQVAAIGQYLPAAQYQALQAEADRLQSLVLYLAQRLQAPLAARVAMLHAAGLSGCVHLIA